MLANGWRTNVTAIGTYGTDYLHRAGVAYGGYGTNVIEDALYPTAFANSDGQQFSSDKRYVLHFAKGQIPPVRGFWSLTMYDERQLFIPFEPSGRCRPSPQAAQAGGRTSTLHALRLDGYQRTCDLLI